MSGKKDVFRYFLITMIVVVLISILVILRGGFTGYAVFEDSGSDFDFGSYVNTSYNGSGVVLVGGNLSGSYISEVFDAGADSIWNNLSYVGSAPSSENLYAVDASGNVYSSFEGLSWTEINDTYFSQDIYGITSTSNGLFVVTKDKAVHKSTNNGLNWVLVNSVNITQEPRGITSDLSENLYIVARSKQIYKSINNGASWSLINSSYSDKDNANEYGIGYDGSYFYVFDNDKSVLRSSTGISWIKINSTYFSQDIYGITSTSNGLFVVTKDKAVHKSVNNGLNWVLVNSVDIAQEPRGITSNSSNIYIIAKNSEIYKSTNNGVNFSIINIDFSKTDNANEYGIHYNGYLYAADNDKDFFRANNGDIAWVQKVYNFGRTLDTSDMFSDNKYLYIISASNKEVWRSNNGVSWNVISSGFCNNNLLEGISDSSGNLYVVDASGDVYKSNNYGVSWSLQGDFNGGATNNAKGIAINSNNIFVVDGSGAVFLSSDQGVNWQEKTSGYGGSSGTDDMAGDGSNLYILNNKQIYKSTDNGVTWGIINNSFTSYANDGLKIDNNNTDLYIIDSPGRVWKSVNGGINWRELEDFNHDATNDCKGLTDFLRNANLTFQIRNCSLADCSDGVWQTLNLNNLNLQSRYFQYKVIFTSPSSSASPLLESVSVDYTTPANTTYVDDDFNEATEGWGVTHFKNITSAMNAVASGGFVYVANGIYNERLTLTKSVNIVGSGAETTKINGGGTGNVISVSIGNVNISGFNITGSGVNWGNSGIYFNSVGSSVIKNNYFSGNRVGISLIGSPSNKIYSNYIVDSTEYGIYANNWATQNNQIYNNYFNNSNNFYAASQPPNLASFNITKTSGINIVGGDYIGGNYWNTYSGTNRGDGFGDTPYNVQGSYYDYLPLLDNSAPVISITYPENISYGANENLYLNFSVSDLDNDLDSCWYNINEGSNINLVNCQNISFSLSPGTYALNLYANDSYNLIGSSDVSFEVVNTAPVISIILPQEGTTYGYNESLELNFSVIDNEDNLDSCWYNLDSGENIMINNCQNISFDISEGSHALNLYANDSYNLIGSGSVNFNVQVGAPTITLNFPINNYLSYNNIQFNYTPSDIDLDSCELWGNFNGVFEKNQTDINVISGQVNSFYLNLDDGIYLWNIKCNDSVGNHAFNGNKSFYVDTVDPDLSLSQPNGAKTSRTNIPLTFSVSDLSPLNCSYNLTSSVGTPIVSNVNIVNCLSTVFSVSNDGDYIIYLRARDSAGHSSIVDSSFSVDTSEPVTPPPSGGGGGGSSSGYVNFTLINEGKMEISYIGEIIVQSGDKKTLSLNVKNTGKTFLNNCRLVAKGEISSWVYIEQIKGIAPGESIGFVFDLNIPEGIEEKSYSGELEVICDEKTESKSISIRIPKGFGLIKINEIKYEKKGLSVSYSLDSSNIVGKDISVEIWIVNEDNQEVKRYVDSFSINKEGLIERNILIEIPDNLVGIYNVYFALSSELNNFVKQSVVLGKSSTTGEVIFGSTRGRIIGYVVFVIIIVIGVFFIYRGYKKKSKKPVKPKKDKPKNKKLLNKRK